MTSNRDRAALLERVLRAVVAADRVELELLLTDDARIWTPEVSAGTRTDFLELLKGRDDAFSDFAVEVVPLDVGGQYGCAEWTVAMVHTGPIELPDGLTIEQSGLPIVLHGATVAEFDGEQICSLRQYWNQFSLLDQLGVTLRPG
jgi:ketosteroid isomerase-like protein